MPARVSCQLGFKAGSLTLALLCAIALVAPVASGVDVDPTLETAIARADLIVIARVIEMIDTKPEAEAMRHLEAHWIVVEETLMGRDQAGQRLRARPQGLLWEIGRSYVLFLEAGEDDSVAAVPQPLSEASEPTLGTVRALIEAQGGSVLPALTIWVRHYGGSGSGLLAEFGVTSDGRFEYRVKRLVGLGETTLEVWFGTLPADVQAALVAQIEAAGEAPVADDAGQLSIRWGAQDGSSQSLSWWLPQEPPASTLLDSIDRLGREYGELWSPSGSCRSSAPN